MPGSVVCAPRSTRSPPWDGTSTATAMRPTKIMNVSVRGWSFASNIDLSDGLRLAAGRILMEESIHGDHCDRRCWLHLPQRGAPAAGPGRDRKSVGSGKSVSVRLDLGGSRIIKKKK